MTSASGRRGHSKQPRKPSSNVRLMTRRTVYRGRVIQLVVEQFRAHGHRLVRETVVHPGAVVIVPLLERSRLVFVRQYRRAVQRYLLELPAGTLDPGERREVCARRELEEEAGWRAGRLQRLCRFYPAPGFTSEELTVFIATHLTPTPARPEPDEYVTPVILSLRTALAKIRSGQIRDAKTIIGVLLVRDLLRTRSREA